MFPGWPAEKQATTLGHLLVRLVAETAQHAGHVDIMREGIDGQGSQDHDDIEDSAFWSRYVAQIQAAAETYR